MTNAVRYVRVSFDKQADLWIGLAAQRERLTSYAALYDIELVAIEEDAGESAKRLLRPGLNRVLTMLESGEVEAVLVAKLDRLTRSVRDGERTSAALPHKKRLGQYTGAPLPYGYRLAADSVHLAPSTLEQEVILEAKKRKVPGWSLRRAGHSLTAEGMPTRNGRPWHPGQVARLLKASHGS